MFTFHSTLRLLTTLLLAMAVQGTEATLAAEWSIPLAGNAFPTTPGQRLSIGRNGVLTLRPKDRCFVYFRVSRPAELQLALQGQTRHTTKTADTRTTETKKGATIVAQLGDQQVQATLQHESAIVAFGSKQLLETSIGYVRLEFHRPPESKANAEITHLIVSSETKDLELAFVKNNKGNMFYWGRRGPSVHLRYEVPKSPALRYAYSEITVPKGKDPIGSYYMANGFGEGYFGIQVNSSKERRVLFSVWSPFKTDNPREVPKEQRIELMARGDKVHTGKFGNEGSGGQSYLVYPWESGRTYRFLTEVIPDGDGKTTYTSWFGDKSANEWRLIASFRRPKTDKHLTGFHSFLESFSPAYGHIERRAQYENVWVGDVEGTWHECTQARLSVDATGKGGHRLDFDGGSDGSHFYMRNCGFFNETGRAGTVFDRASTAGQRPKIDLAKLPRG